MDTPLKPSHLVVDTSIAGASRPTRPSLSRNPSSSSRRGSPSNPFAAVLPPTPPTASPVFSYPPRSSKLGSSAIWRALSTAIPPNSRRIFTTFPFMGFTVLVLLTTTYYLTRTHPRSLPSSYPPGLSSSNPLALNTLPDLPAAYYAEHFPTLQLPESILKLPLLADRLHAFLNRPISSYTTESSAEQHESCPAKLADKLVNPDQFRDELDFWRGVDEREIAKRRAGVVQWLERRLALGETVVGSEDTGIGRGIVLTGGNKDTTYRMISVLKHLRRLNVDLPIEVFHYDDELRDQGQRKEIEGLGAKIVQVHGVVKEAGAWKNWQIKGLAIVQSSFREVLYLDSDNTPLRDPSHLFSAPIYLNQGRAVFWPDLSKDHPDNAIWRIIGDKCSLSHWTFESGQIIIDKAGNDGLNLAALLIASDMQGERDFWFHFCGGDKDTFRWAFRTLGLEWGRSPRWMSALGFLNRYEGGRFCGHTVLQYDLVIPKGMTREPPLFVHSNLLKHLGAAGLNQGSLFTHVKRMSDDRVSNPILDHAHSWVYQGVGRGMCLDLEWHDSTQEERGGVEVETVEVGDIEGKVFEGFEDAFFDEGGRIGGW